MPAAVEVPRGQQAVAAMDDIRNLTESEGLGKQCNYRFGFPNLQWRVQLGFLASATDQFPSTGYFGMAEVQPSLILQ